MKQFFTLLALTFCLFSKTTIAQLPSNSFAENFTFVDLNGNTQDLYAILNSGKTVFLDVSATWCGPCWNYHQAHHLKALWEAHGPAGATGVRANTTNDVFVLFIEGDSTTGLDALNGQTSNTMGNWVAGTPYPIINTTGAGNAAFDLNYSINYYPTLYKVCKDRIVTELNQIDSTALYATVGSCPTYNPSTTVDAKMVKVNSTAWVCNSPIQAAVKFQNYSNTNLNAATIKVIQGASTLSTTNWTGSLTPYKLATQNVTFTPTGSAPIYYTVLAANDTRVSNDSLLKNSNAYATANVSSLPTIENLNGTSFPSKFSVGNATDTADFAIHYSSNTLTTKFPTYKDAAGSLSGAGVFDCFNFQNGTSILVLGNYNANAKGINVEFDYSHAGYTAAAIESDELELIHSSDCGATWKTEWKKTGADLCTAPATTLEYFPTMASQWSKSKSTFVGTSDNELIALRATSGYGNYIWFDNINISTVPQSINNSIKELVKVTIAPNPVIGNLNLKIDSKENIQFAVEISDVTGRVLMSLPTASIQNKTIDVSGLSQGQYILTLKSDKGNITKPFTK